MTTSWTPRPEKSTSYGVKKVELYPLFDAGGNPVTDNDGVQLYVFGEAGSGIPYSNTSWGVRDGKATVWSQRTPV